MRTFVDFLREYPAEEVPVQECLRELVTFPDSHKRNEIIAEIVCAVFLEGTFFVPDGLFSDEYYHIEK